MDIIHKPVKQYQTADIIYLFIDYKIRSLSPFTWTNEAPIDLSLQI